ncbi:hypothetical protein Glove_139g91 [Diversispora epigaea]|uniref:Uncharacterized protein n=1 Tax=Diversispora epigaea TaxID=1348612 RepID=A0A397J035_9GLOM|nr:hypothetical protein Glove_139g91 [Diversispora epigaea]
MAENIPESLETIEIGKGIFSADSLRKIFEGCCFKGGGRNEKIILEYFDSSSMLPFENKVFSNLIFMSKIFPSNVKNFWSIGRIIK